MSTLYDTDFAEWVYYNADLLRSGRVSGSQSQELKSRMIQISERLLKLRLTKEDLVERNGRDWRGSIARERGEIPILLDDSPSLRRRRKIETLNECYSVRARAFEASFEITAPAESPFTFDEILGE